MARMRKFEQAGFAFTESLSDIASLESRGATIGGTPTFGVNPLGGGKAITLDSSNPDYASFDDATVDGDLITTEDFSVVAWINNSSSLVLATSYAIVSDKETANLTKIGWSFRLSGSTDNGLAFDINDGDAAADTEITLSTARNDLLSDGAWHQVAVTADRDGNALLYVDDYAGEGGSIAVQNKTLSNDQDLAIGIMGNKVTTPFNGMIKNVMIIRRLLSATEIGDLYTFGAF